MAEKVEEKEHWLAWRVIKLEEVFTNTISKENTDGSAPNKC